MTTKITDRQLVWIALAIVAALIIIPTFGMGFGMMGSGPMMGGTWSHGMWDVGRASGWMLVVGLGMQFLFIALVVGVAYLGFRALTGQTESSDPATEELRMAYARGDLSEEEYERRKARLEPES